MSDNYAVIRQLTTPDEVTGEQVDTYPITCLDALVGRNGQPYRDELKKIVEDSVGAINVADYATGFGGSHVGEKIPLTANHFEFILKGSAYGVLNGVNIYSHHRVVQTTDDKVYLAVCVAHDATSGLYVVFEKTTGGWSFVSSYDILTAPAWLRTVFNEDLRTLKADKSEVDKKQNKTVSVPITAEYSGFSGNPLTTTFSQSGYWTKPFYLKSGSVFKTSSWGGVLARAAGSTLSAGQTLTQDGIEVISSGSISRKITQDGWYCQQGYGQSSPTAATITVEMDLMSYLLTKAGQEDIQALGLKVGNFTSASHANVCASIEALEAGGGGGGSVEQIQSDWTQTDTTKKDYIKNKPTLASVATSGSYNDLQNKPTIPSTDGLETSAHAAATYQPKGNYITDISGKADKVEIVTDAATDAELQPNKFYKWGEVATLAPTLATPTDTEHSNEYMFEFVSGATATSLTLPDGVSVANDVTIEARKTYQVSILDNIALIVGV